MGFFSFNEKYYRDKLQALENKVLSDEEIYEAKQILKVLDDLEDEGYNDLNNYMEETFGCRERLRNLLKNNNAAPFALGHVALEETVYSAEEVELESLMDRLMQDASKQTVISDNPFLKDIRDYCDWIGYEEDTAYVFLFRDSLLPYVYYRSQTRRNIYPWLISRKFVTDITQSDELDDDIRMKFFDALETGHVEFDDFVGYCRENTLKVLKDHPKLQSEVEQLLQSVTAQKIVVIESGYCGTFPMMLRAMDDRVSFVMYTTAPYFYKTYKANTFCRRYEDIRMFETLYSQDLLMQYASCRDGKFYVRTTADETVYRKSLAELRYYMQ